ncbi:MULTISPECIES: hypothetical protein [unclassified Granulicatella]|uniref:Thoeris anti-defense Tad2 family protein n=1 Tax=unclassified Granulicatella TaxID=2630493 RepID=UPI0010738279|nr:MULTISPECIES: hypothetical protein [unclassified Granulicatella]MBF0781153.1 hypothetical protein [Granulicatella sp. 19428wC4_WM01]TFU91705.1 hypothetical protein E4T68_08625 [Granulicatella sp. WM01]
MEISKAIKEAKIKNVGIRRSSWLKDYIVIPTNSEVCCIIGPTRDKKLLAPRWNPTSDELTADDWEVTTKKMVWH